MQLMASKVTKQLAQHIREVYFGVNWTWSYLKEQLSDVTWQEATTKIDSLNTIIGLTYHIHYYVAPLISVVKDGVWSGEDKLSFDHPDIKSKEDWANFLVTFFEEAESLASLIEEMDEESLWKTEEKFGNYFKNIQGFVEHCHYHLGQIVVIKKLLRGGNQ